MEHNRLTYYLRLCRGPLLMLLAGIVLTFWSDSAVTLVTRIGAWLLLATGVYNLIRVASRRGDTRFWVRTVLFLGLGIYILLDPMTISRLLGRIVGVLLMLQGIRDLRGAGSRTLGIATIVAGVVLFVLPVTVTQALLMLLGVVLMVVGAIHLAERLFRTRRLSDGDDPNIIDAAP